MEIGEKIKELRLLRGMTLEELATRLGTTKQTVSRYEKGIISIYLDRIPAIAEALGTTPSELLTLTDERCGGGLPLLMGLDAAGQPIYRDSGHSADGRVDFCLYAVGEEMKGGRICDGDLLYLCRCERYGDGELAALSVGDGVLLRRVYQDPEHRQTILKSENPRIAPTVYVGRERERVRIFGKVVAFYANLE